MANTHAERAIATTNDEGLGSARTEAPFGSTNAPDCPNIDDTGKGFATARAKLAMKGYGLSRTHAADEPVTYFVARWGWGRELRDIAAVADFAVRLGAAS